MELSGGFAGSLVGFGIPEYEAKRYEGQMLKGTESWLPFAAIHDDQTNSRQRRPLTSWCSGCCSLSRDVLREQKCCLGRLLFFANLMGLPTGRPVLSVCPSQYCSRL